ncbi:galactosyltransferase-related protein [Streptomyces sp. ICN988]|uniref:glycosyltransferase n=1 Tax=Streptomyces sp. ICN988 TaxID=2983765 RepID=UPI0021E38B56|nr:glycosyltransferase family 2 protein [Streptomyces sp. ICN988]MCV2458435.1 galactosyltransferase-related protein [Streptomyces sp. ICN988]
MDAGAKQAALSYWYGGRDVVVAVAETLAVVDDVTVRSLGERLIAQPSDAGSYWDLRAALTVRAAQRNPLSGLFAASWRAEINSRLGYHLGASHHPALGDVDVSVEKLSSIGVSCYSPVVEAPCVQVVIPFRDRGTNGWRARNLISCLLALKDQDYPRDRYMVTVVEADTEPRWKRYIEPLCDDYVFARRGGAFNKSWAVNVGVVNNQRHSEIVTILDADVLCDRAFLSRNAARLDRAGTAAHLPYRDMLCLDPVASRYAIDARVRQGQPVVPSENLRGFLVRRPPGACVWVRTELFRRVGGMDERYEGWGGEDNDFVFRVDLQGVMDHYDDDLLHLHHPPSSRLINGRGINDHIPPLSWTPDREIGILSDGRTETQLNARKSDGELA